MSDEGSDAEVYEVEKLLDKRVKKGKTEYLVKWKGQHIVMRALSMTRCNDGTLQDTRTSPRIPGSPWRISTARTRSRSLRRSTR